MDKMLSLVQAAKDGDKSKRDELVKENTGLIWSVVKRFLNRGHEAEDLFQIGAIGLIKSIDKFDMSFNVKFSTYAVPMIMGEIKRFLRDDGMIKVSRSLKETAAKARYVQERFQKETGKSPTIREIAAALDQSEEDVVLALESGLLVESLHQTVHQGDGAPVYLIDKLDQNAAEDSKMVDILALKEIILKLNPKERQVIFLRYFKDKTQNETAKIVGVSQVQISRIEKKVLANIREQMLY